MLNFEIIAAPCALPPIQHGQYLSGYRAGLTIANGSYVNYQCDHEFMKITAVPTECFRGELLPKKPACRRGKKSVDLKVFELLLYL